MASGYRQSCAASSERLTLHTRRESTRETATGPAGMADPCTDAARATECDAAEEEAAYEAAKPDTEAASSTAA